MVRTVTLSTITAPPATTPPSSTVACLTVDPIPTKALFPNVAPWRIVFGPIKQLFPIDVSLEMYDLSWIIVLLPE